MDDAIALALQLEWAGEQGRGRGNEVVMGGVSSKQMETATKHPAAGKKKKKKKKRQPHCRIKSADAMRDGMGVGEVALQQRRALR
jgi:hypothetical protein